MLEQSGGKERGGKSYIVFQPKMAEKIHKELNFHETGKLQFFCGGGLSGGTCSQNSDLAVFRNNSPAFFRPENEDH